MAAPTWTPPAEFEEYRLIRRLGHGSMGQVWLAHDLLLDRRVAIKFIGTLADQSTLRERFLNEARAIAKLAHPNVVTVHRIGTLDNQPFMVSELIEGGSLDQLSLPLPTEKVLRLAVDLARGLAAAHRAGILHRDVKPANAMLTSEGVAKLLDFGLAKFGGRTVAPGPVAPHMLDAALKDLEATPADDINATLASPRPALVATPVPEAALTQRGAILGTPLYLAPECWKGEAASRRSDVYSLGALLYELCARQAPVRFLSGGPINHCVTTQDARPLLEVAPGIEARLARVIDQCLARDPAARFSSGDELRDALERLLVLRHEDLPRGNPYRGLAAFDEAHRALFFGRTAEVRAVCDRLRSRSLVVVAGESGVGKSSVCRAGVVPAVAAGALGDARTWSTVVSLPGRHPLKSLAAACAAALGLDEAHLTSVLAAEPASLSRITMKALGPARGLLVFVDQLEEWDTFADPEEARLAARALSSLAEGLPAVRVLASARTDLLSRLSTLPGLGAELSGALYLLGPVAREHLHQVVTGPAEAYGVRFESPTMVERFVDFVAQGGALPLLQFSLARLWEGRGSSDVLTEASLTAMGGVAGSLASHADGVLASMPAEQRTAARTLLLGLVTANDTRRRRAEAELVKTAAHAAALATLAGARLLLARDSEEGTVWEIAHEALLREWPTLRQWLSDDSDARVWRDRLATATTEWERLGRPGDVLWNERQVSDALRVLNEGSLALNQTSFLSSARRRNRLRRWRVPLVVAGLVVSVGATWGGLRGLERTAAERRASQHLGIADTHLVAASVARAQFEETRAAAFVAFDEGDWPTGEERWGKARALRDTWQQDLSLALAEVEAAQLMLPTHAGLGTRLLAAAEQRIVFDEAVGQEPEIAAEVRRLESLGASRDELAHLTAPASVQVTVLPADATIKLERYDALSTRAVATPVRALASGERVGLPAGSWRLVLSAPGYEAAFLPFVTARGKAAELRAQLRPSAGFPVGFVHVPGGQSLVGSAGDDSVRREFYEAAPLHSVHVDDFLIGRHEVTFAEWFEYLEALPEAERRLRTPHIESSLGTADTANLRVERAAAGWVLSIKPVTHRYTARPGEPLTYVDRQTNAQQDWLQMPVVGISPPDVEQYAQWLDGSGRVPGARICSEYEWERAARGADGRTLPHGEIVSPEDANIDETYGRRDAAFGPDEVGRHPASRSPFGVDDLFGNVWEIVRPTSRAKPWANKGGSWQVNTLSGRAPNQWVINPGYRQVETGARVCASLPR